MPCKSDDLQNINPNTRPTIYIDPTPYEYKIKETVKLLCYVYGWLDKDISEKLKQATNEKIYFSSTEGDKWISALCKVLTDMSIEDRDQLIYDNRVKLSRKLADWWEDNVEADTKKLEFEKKNERRKAIRALALGKLTKEEREVLGL